MQTRALYRLGRALLHLLAGWVTIVFAFPKLSIQERQHRVQAWSAGMLAHLGITPRVLGMAPTQGPLMLACNHVSWLDITSLHAACHCRFVAKAQIRHWPLVGALAAGVGTLFIERESRRDAMRVVHQMAQSLQGGDVLAVFPQGTTGDPRQLLPFFPNLFQAAISAPAPVLPVAIEYLDKASQTPSEAPVYIGGMTLLASVWRTLCAPPIEVVIRFGPLQPTVGADRRTVASQVQNAVADLLKPP